MRILFITNSRIGDAVLSTGVLAHLIERHPAAEITIACGRAAGELFVAVPGVREVYLIDKEPRGRHWLKLWRHMAPQRWDIIVDLRASAIAYFLWAGRRYVMKASKTPEHRLVHLARVVGMNHVLPPRIWIRPEHELAACNLLPEGPPTLAVAPTANWRGKIWPSDRFAELVARLTATDGILPHARVVVLGAGGERTLAEPVLASVRAARCIDLVGKVDLLTAFAALRRCAFFVGNDSGLMHLAAASGTPTLGLFGPSRVEHYAPWGVRTAAVCTPVPYDTLARSPGYHPQTTDTLMDSLTVEMVEAAAIDLWRRNFGEAA
ncbi:MAG TPA: glycosyltransferase family 9 protein [Alphaproteobacteria bacterium]|nr:glycosyltransferase family 9 protein [Alphaproteobacteria bacterium]